MFRAFISLILATVVASPPLHPAFASETSQSATADPNGPIAYLPSLAGGYFVLNSQQAERPYHIFVRLPEGYNPQRADAYPTVYLLDGDTAFPMLAPLHLLLTYDDKLPEAIVVGIAYGSFGSDKNTRGYDFRMVMPDGTRGGMPQLMEMLERELVPRIEANYRADPARRILVGQSRGGAGVLQVAWNRPELFWGYIASNPSTEAHSEQLYGMDETPRGAQQNGYLVLASGSNNYPSSRQRALEWRGKFTVRDDLPWQARFVDIPGGTHAADLGRAYREAMRIMFADAIADSQTGESNNAK